MQKLFHLELNCQAKQVWHLSRHGTRYPEKDETEAFRKLVKTRDEIFDRYNKNKSKVGEFNSYSVYFIRLDHKK